MATEPAIPKVIKLDIAEVEYMLSGGHLRAAVKLLHCFIDELAFLSSHSVKPSNSNVYKDYVAKYILPHYNVAPPISAEELWESRNGFVHTSTFKGERSSVKTFLTWTFEKNCGCHGYMSGFSKNLGCENAKNVHLVSFWTAVKQGVADFFADPQRPEALVRERLALFANFTPFSRKPEPGYVQLIPVHHHDPITGKIVGDA